MARRVAWTSCRQSAETGTHDLPKGWNVTIYLHSELRQRWQAQNLPRSTTDLAGGAPICKDVSADRYFLQKKGFVSHSRIDGFDQSSAWGPVQPKGWLVASRSRMAAQSSILRAGGDDQAAAVAGQRQTTTSP